MPYYRVLKPLSKGMEEIIPKGVVVNIHWVSEEGLMKLQNLGAISPLRAPPLSKIPGWSRRAQRLGGIGIHSVNAFLEGDNATIGKGLRVKPETVNKWKEELLSKWLGSKATLPRG